MKVSVVASSTALKLTYTQSACLMAWMLQHFCSKMITKLSGKKRQLAWFNTLRYTWADGDALEFLQLLSKKSLHRFLKEALPSDTSMRIDLFQEFLEFLERPMEAQLDEALLKRLCSSRNLTKAVFDLPKYAAAELLICAGDRCAMFDFFEDKKIKESFDLGCHYWHFKQAVGSVAANKVFEEDIDNGTGLDNSEFWDGYNVSGILNDPDFKSLVSI